MLKETNLSAKIDLNNKKEMVVENILFREEKRTKVSY